jgi:hypothetical protein
MGMSEDKTLRVVIFRDDEGWAAQCLEYDICAYADDLSKLQSRFEATLVCEYEISNKLHGSPLAGIGPAPEKFQEMWKGCAGKYEPYNNAKLSERNIDFALCA